MAVTKLLLVALLSAWISACSISHSSTSQEGERWQSALYLDHPLVGSIWDVKNKRQLSTDDLLQELESARYLLLGEKHDNPDHHNLQYAVTSSIIASGKLSLLSFEMMTEESQPLLNEVPNQTLSSLEAIASYLQWDNEGWDWDFYGPLVQLGVDNKIPLAAANISSETMRSVYGAVADADSAEFLKPEVIDQLNKDIDSSHCGLLPESQFPAMVRVQRARDAAMAKSLEGAGPGDVAVLIAGNYHVRKDLGVPNYLAHSNSSLAGQDIVAVSFMEVSPEASNLADYIEATAGVDAYDYIWFTPAVSNEDYCASMRE